MLLLVQFRFPLLTIHEVALAPVELQLAARGGQVACSQSSQTRGPAICALGSVASEQQPAMAVRASLALLQLLAVSGAAAV